MTEAEIEVTLQRAREKYPEAKPRIISDNGPQFIARDFEEFIRSAGMTHVRTSPCNPQSNGKLKRWQKSLKSECLRRLTPLTMEDAHRGLEERDRFFSSPTRTSPGPGQPAQSQGFAKPMPRRMNPPLTQQVQVA